MRIMKKRHLIILAAAAMTACTNQEVLTDALSHNNYVKNPIGFSSFSEMASKGDPSNKLNLEYYHNSFVVYGTKKNVNNPAIIDSVFGGLAQKPDTLNGVECRYLDNTLNINLGDWRYEGPRYWDRQAKYCFVAYAPASANNPLRYFYHKANALIGDTLNKFITSTPYVLQGTNLQNPASSAVKIKGFNEETGGDLDLMISDTVPELGSNHNSNNGGVNNYVQFQFRHILAKFNVNIVKTEAVDKSIVTMKEIRIEGLKDRGSYDESRYVNNADTVISGWTASYSATPSTYVITYNGSQTLNNGSYPGGVYKKGDPIYFIESLIMPQQITAANQVKMYLTYTIKENKEGAPTQNFTDQEIDLYDIAEYNHEFLDGFNYVLNLTIGPDLIMLDPGVTTWDLQTKVADHRIGD